MSVPSPAKSRPSVVTAAGYLLFGVAILAVVNALLPLPYVGHASTVAHEAYSKIQNGDTVASAYSAITYTVSFAYLLAAAGFILLSLFDLRGNNGTRIATFVIGGIGVLCCGASIGIGRLASGIGQSGNGNNADAQAAAKKVAAAYPSWLTGTQTLLAILALLSMILVLILLALPASSAYFRRSPAQVLDPGLPPPPYPPAGGTAVRGAPASPPVPPSSQDQ